MDGMMCAMPNATARASNANYRPIKMCLCNPDEGYVERDWYCSGMFYHTITITITSNNNPGNTDLLLLADGVMYQALFHTITLGLGLLLVYSY